MRVVSAAWSRELTSNVPINKLRIVQGRKMRSAMWMPQVPSPPPSHRASLQTHWSGRCKCRKPI